MNAVLKLIMFTLIGFATIRGLYLNIVSNLTFNAPWTVGEWLINYAGGFVRRGAPGELIYRISVPSGISPWCLAVVMSFICWGGLAILLTKFCSSRFRLAFIFSPFVLLAPLMGEYLVRKDCLNLFILCASLLISSRRSMGKASFVLRVLAVNILGVLASLSHETYLFYFLPSHLVVMYGSAGADGILASRLFKKIPQLLLLFCPVVVTTFFCVYHHGSPAVSHEIYQSWLNLSTMFPSSYPIHAQGAIDAIGWSTSYGFDYTNKPILYQLANGFIWRPLALIITVWILGAIASSDFAIKENDLQFARCVRLIFTLIIFSMVPVFVIGHDYGRWLFMAVVATIFSASVFTYYDDRATATLSPAHLSLSNPGFYSLYRAGFSLAPFFFGIPPYWNSWNLAWSAQNSLTGYLLNVIAGSVGIRFMALYLPLLIVAYIIALRAKLFVKI